MVNAAVPAPTGIPRPAEIEPVPLSRIAELLGAEAAAADVRVTGVASASSYVHPGDLFVGLPGTGVHGASYAEQAREAGAVAVLTDAAGADLDRSGLPRLIVADARGALGPAAAEIYGHPSRALDLIGVTGTSGKTTTTFLIRAGLEAAGIPSGLIGTVGTFIGTEAIKTGFTTPEADQVHALLAVMRERGARAVVMEVSSHALRLGRVKWVEFAVGGFTNLSQDHLDFHKDMTDYFLAKAELFAPGVWPVIVIDDEWGHRMVDVVGPCTTVSTGGGEGSDEEATWRALAIREQHDGTSRFRVLRREVGSIPGRGIPGIPGVDFETGCAIPGKFNVANALLALAILDRVGVDVAQVHEAVALASVPGRMQRIDAGQPFLAVVDYSHKPAAVEGALRALRPLTRGRLLIVLGCGGDRDRAKRPMMGEVAARDADLLVVTDDNPRSEDPAEIRAAMLAGARAVTGGGEVVEVGDRRDAIEYAVGQAGPDDVVLIAGKGHETGQEIAGHVLPFDDATVLREAITGSAGVGG